MGISSNCSGRKSGDTKHRKGRTGATRPLKTATSQGWSSVSELNSGPMVADPLRSLHPRNHSRFHLPPHPHSLKNMGTRREPSCSPWRGAGRSSLLTGQSCGEPRQLGAPQSQLLLPCPMGASVVPNKPSPHSTSKPWVTLQFSFQKVAHLKFTQKNPVRNSPKDAVTLDRQGSWGLRARASQPAGLSSNPLPNHVALFKWRGDTPRKEARPGNTGASYRASLAPKTASYPLS